MSQEQDFNPNVRFDEEMLLCPRCGFLYTHATGVDVFSRAEDAQEGRRVSVRSKSLRTDTDIKQNPSLRRGGIRIFFWCEGCGQTSGLVLCQHKGITLVSWESTPVVDDDTDAEGMPSTI